MSVELLRQRETDLVDIISAIKSISESSEFKTLKKLVFDGVVESLQRRIHTEATKSNLDDPEIYRLNGQLMWAKKYADLEKLADGYRLELNNIRKQYG